MHDNILEDEMRIQNYPDSNLHGTKEVWFISQFFC